MTAFQYIRCCGLLGFDAMFVLQCVGMVVEKPASSSFRVEKQAMQSKVKSHYYDLIIQFVIKPLLGLMIRFLLRVEGWCRMIWGCRLLISVYACLL